MMKRMSFSETIFLFFLALIIFGPKKLPEIARTIGKYLNEFRRASNEFKAQIEQEIHQLEVDQRKQAALAPARRAEETDSSNLQAGTLEGHTVETAPSGPVGTVAATSPAQGADEGGETPLAAERSLPPGEASAPVTSSTTQESHA
jgi:sec-independent protein translocase protein TatB